MCVDISPSQVYDTLVYHKKLTPRAFSGVNLYFVQYSQQLLQLFHGGNINLTTVNVMYTIAP